MADDEGKKGVTPVQLLILVVVLAIVFFVTYQFGQLIGGWLANRDVNL